jgi:hypothetical protein
MGPLLCREILELADLADLRLGRRSRDSIEGWEKANPKEVLELRNRADVG